jgi:hypothetical protein
MNKNKASINIISFFAASWAKSTSIKVFVSLSNVAYEGLSCKLIVISLRSFVRFSNFVSIINSINRKALKYLAANKKSMPSKNCLPF